MRGVKAQNFGLLTSCAMRCCVSPTFMGYGKTHTEAPVEGNQTVVSACSFYLIVALGFLGLGPGSSLQMVPRGPAHVLGCLKQEVLARYKVKLRGLDHRQSLFCMCCHKTVQANPGVLQDEILVCLCFSSAQPIPLHQTIQTSTLLCTVRQ